MNTAGVAAAAAIAFALRSGESPRRVAHRERADGVLPQLQDLLSAWDASGTHDALVAPEGGLRTDAAAQARYAAQGNSNAKTLDQTPHGRGGAVDVWPVSFLPYVSSSWGAVPDEVRAEFKAFGQFAESRGLRWGGRWSGPTFPDGDQPHVEMSNWREYPYPPQR